MCRNRLGFLHVFGKVRIGLWSPLQEPTLQSVANVKSSGRNLIKTKVPNKRQKSNRLGWFFGVKFVPLNQTNKCPLRSYLDSGDQGIFCEDGFLYGFPKLNRLLYFNQNRFWKLFHNFGWI